MAEGSWDEAGLFHRAARSETKPKYYVLEMFPYPSGRIHIGHVRNYTMGDVVARYKRAADSTCLHPMGWDAFGMPAENAAMERKVHPGQLDLREHRRHARRSSSLMGLSIDWSREIATCHPGVLPAPAGRRCSWTCWKRAGSYRARRVLGRELGPGRPDGAGQRTGDRRRGWRSGALVERRELTAMGLQDLRHGRRAAGGAGRAEELAREGPAHAGQLDRPVRGPAVPVRDGRTTWSMRPRLEVYTTRHDTLFGASFARYRRITRWPRRWKAKVAEGLADFDRPNAAGWVPRRRRWRRPRNWASIPGSGWCTRSIRTGSCRSMSRTSS